ncbi:FecR family protein [Rhabdobacter roseus]|uniref:Ferric-dicitrate binding protein FerR (Iron transport regulator) n=1 Tax=Rhabdobacter roseus TaxID=1655419 RepID=A0A840TVS9_9BACT|nr:FecR family protein [Rhabdobacter roseus]MBB5283759.1 ferric-dicitrate binding protein FerR (iron transport regulator) [Rhabdobacter roseus]
MKRYRDYTPEELALDESFQRWVKDHTDEDQRFWSAWVTQNPDREVLVREARQLLLLLREKPFLDLSEDVIREDIQRTRERIGAHEVPFRPSRRVLWGRVAAAWLLLGGLASWLFWTTRETTLPENNTRATATEKETRLVNSGSAARQVLLPDGSRVTMSAGSELSYAENGLDERVVRLSGEAYFEVKRQPTRPFMVYANGLVTRVLGTSFRISPSASTPSVRVVVLTGKVSVFAQQDFEKNTQHQSTVMQGLILTPNQQVDYSPSEGIFRRSLVKQPQKVTASIREEDFEFRSTPVVEIIGRLEQAYGVEFVYDEELLRDCALTASLADEPLYDKIKLICQGINATYQEVDGRIVISSKGCR